MSNKVGLQGVALISDRGFVLDGCAANADIIMKTYTLKSDKKDESSSKYAYSKADTVQFYKTVHNARGEQMFLLPRFCEVKNTMKHVRDIRNRMQSHIENINTRNNRLRLTGHNQHVVSEVLAKHDNATLVAKTGEGKSFIAMHRLAQLHVKTLIVVHNTPMADQWRSVVTNAFPDLKIGSYNGSDKSDGDVVIAIVNSLRNMSAPYFPRITNVASMSKYDRHHKYAGIKGGEGYGDANLIGRCYVQMEPSEFYGRFGLVIIDEVHTMCTESAIGMLFNMSQIKYSLALTATPDTSNIGRMVQSGFLGSFIDTEKLQNYNTSEVMYKAVVHSIRYRGKAEYTTPVIARGSVSYAPTLNTLVEDPQRLALAVDIITRAQSRGENMYVFADRRELLQRLQTMLPVSATTVLVAGGASEDELKAAKAATTILSTYQFLSTGFSLSNMTSLLMLTPRKTGLEQIIGRITRKNAKYAEVVRHIYDIVDVASPLGRQWSTRYQFYCDKHYNVTTCVVGNNRRCDCHSISATSIDDGDDNNNTTDDSMNIDGCNEDNVGNAIDDDDGEETMRSALENVFVFE